MGFAGQLEKALNESTEIPVTDEGLLVKIVRLSHDNAPGQDIPGVLPMVVVGHASMEEDVWRRWVRENGIPHYGAAFTEKMVQNGVSIREMMPTAAFGRQMRDWRKNVRYSRNAFMTLDRAEQVLTAIEKWPSLYNLVVTEMEGETMTLETFVDRVTAMPSPIEHGRGAYTTLGDLISPHGMLLPDY